MTTFSTASQPVGFTSAMTDRFSLSSAVSPTRQHLNRSTISAIKKVGRPPNIESRSAGSTAFTRDMNWNPHESRDRERESYPAPNSEFFFPVTM